MINALSKAKTVFVVAVMSIFFLSACVANNLSNSGKMRVVTSFYPLYFFAQQIGGEKVEIFNITPAGAEPHDYELTAKNISNIESSKLLILNGGGFEAWANDIKQNIKDGRPIIVSAGEGLFVESNPHIWLSPALAVQMVDRIVEGFKQADPVNAAIFAANADLLKNRLRELDDEYISALHKCLHKNIITSHAAFWYLAREFGLAETSIAGLSPDAEPSSRKLGEITDFARANGIKYIFFERLSSPKLSQTLADEVGIQTLVLDPLEGLMPDEIAAGKDYFSDMKSNLANLQIALQCKL